MGGNLLKHITNRISAAGYFDIAQEIIERLVPYTEDLRLIKAYRNKESFGDMDLLVVWNKPIGSMQEVATKLKELFNPAECHINDNIVTFDYAKAQIDLIFTTKEEIEMNELYFSYNDLGNLLGILAKTRNLRLKHTGLYYRYVDTSGQSHDLFLTKSKTKIFYLLDLPVHHYDAGFDELEDIFEFVTLSSLYHPDIFKLESLDHTNRTRNRKRESYMKFLTFIDNHPYTSHYTEKPLEWVIPDAAWRTALARFTGADLTVQVEHIEQQIVEWREYSGKFNGEVVMKLTGLTPGEELGALLKRLKSSLRHPDDQWWQKATPVEVMLEILEHVPASLVDEQVALLLGWKRLPDAGWKYRDEKFMYPFCYRSNHSLWDRLFSAYCETEIRLYFALLQKLYTPKQLINLKPVHHSLAHILWNHELGSGKVANHD